MGDKFNPDRNTLLVYWYLRSQTGNKSGPRSVQRALGFSSPSSALFHLNKLEETGLIQKHRNGSYRITKKKKFGIMKRFFCFHNHWIPKNMAYSVLLLIAISMVLLLFFPIISWYVVAALLPTIFSLALQIYETIVLLKNRPRFNS